MATRQITLEEVPAAVQKLRDSFARHTTKSYEWRIAQLKALKAMITENRDTLIQAVQKDLGKKVPFEIILSEINLPLGELEDTIHHLKEWMAPQPVPTNLAAVPAKSAIYSDPLGTCLIISPWNYPVNLALTPLIGALAGGNTVFLKASRHSANTGHALEKLISKYLDIDCVSVESDGGVDMITRLLEEKWDHIFFTGSVDVGKVVYQAAAKNLTPVVLELGGKNPAIVDKNVDIDFAAKRIAWGKFWNSGQTCITADYVLVHSDVAKQLVEALKKRIFEFHGEDPQQSESYGRIISLRQLKRLQQMIERSGTVLAGGKVDERDLYISPTLMGDVPLDSPLMSEEIFGPVLPIIPVDSIQAAIDFCNARPHPLALYVFTKDESVQDEVFSKTRSGAAVANDLLVHFTNPNLPFGGVGHSGLGAYHGKLTFDTFTHKRAIIKSTSSAILDLPIKYPPYTPRKQMLAALLTSPGFEKRLKGFSKLLLALMALGVARIILVKSSRL